MALSPLPPKAGSQGCLLPLPTQTCSAHRPDPRPQLPHNGHPHLPLLHPGGHFPLSDPISHLTEQLRPVSLLDLVTGSLALKGSQSAGAAGAGRRPQADPGPTALRGLGLLPRSS